MTMVNGRILMKDGKVLSLDEPALLGEVRGPGGQVRGMVTR